MRYLSDPDEARRVLGLRRVEQAGVYVVKDGARIVESRLFKAGDQVPAAYVYDHRRGEQAKGPNPAVPVLPAAPKATADK